VTSDVRQPLKELPLAKFAMEKLVRVLGDSLAKRVFADTLREAGLLEIQTADDLYRFGEKLSMKEGFAAAVGALLTVSAVIRGATALH
jgi:hypothetical protein